MKIIIDIPEEDFGWNGKLNICRCSFERLIQIVSNGIPVPEHHGRLIDADVLKHELIDKEWITDYDGDGLEDIVNEAPTIIEKE